MSDNKNKYDVNRCKDEKDEICELFLKVGHASREVRFMVKGSK